MSQQPKPKKVVVAYSGGLDTSVMVKWIKETYGCEVIAYTADVGQGEELSGLEEKALTTGCSKIFIEDLKEPFVRDYVYFAVKAAAIYEGYYLMGTSVARPLIAKRQIEIAHQVGADAVAHGCTGKGNDQARFELTYYSHDPKIQVIAPWRSWPFKSRTDLIRYAKEHKIPVSVTAEKPYSTDANLMHVSYEGGILEDPWAEAPEHIFRMTKAPEQAPDQPTYVVIRFEKGVPVAVNGESLDPVKLLTKLNAVAGENGVGRVDLVENRFVGMKSRGVYETPGVTLLHHAHRAVESLTMDREVMKIRDSLGPKIAELIYNGFWFSPEFEAVRALTDHIQGKVTGEARLKLYKGNVSIVGRRSPLSLYSEALATFEKDNVYNQADSEGFIKLNALRLRLQQANSLLLDPEKMLEP